MANKGKNKMISQANPTVLLCLMGLVSCGLYVTEHPENGQLAVLFTACFLLAYVSGHALIYFLQLGDSYLFTIVYGLLLVSLTVLFRLDQTVAIKQTKWYAIGTIAYVLIAAVLRYLPLSLKSWYKPALIASVLMLLVTLVFGELRFGAKNWLSLPVIGIAVQPAEFVKITYIFVLSALLSEKKPKRGWFIHLVVYFHLLCLALQNEWGLLALLFFLYLAIAYVSGADKKFLYIHLFIFILGIAVAFMYMDRLPLPPHIKTRFYVWRDPFADTQSGYQIMQSLFSVSEGGFLGVGLGLGCPHLIPAVDTDFIFSAICEELGTFGAVSVLLLYFLLVYRGVKIALMTTDRFFKLLAIGISACFAFQTFIIVGGVLNLIPLTGITLPFISYGGSSLISCFIELALLQVISSQKGAATDEIA